MNARGWGDASSHPRLLGYGGIRGLESHFPTYIPAVLILGLSMDWGSSSCPFLKVPFGPIYCCCCQDPAPNHGCRLFLFPGALWPSSLPQLFGQVWNYLLTKKIQKKDLIVYTYNPSTEEERGLKFQAVLGRIVNCRPARGTV